MSNEVKTFRSHFQDNDGFLEIAGCSDSIRFMIMGIKNGEPDYSGVRKFYLSPSDVRAMHDALAAAGAFCGSVVNCEVFSGGDGT